MLITGAPAAGQESLAPGVLVEPPPAVMPVGRERKEAPTQGVTTRSPHMGPEVGPASIELPSPASAPAETGPPDGAVSAAASLPPGPAALTDSVRGLTLREIFTAKPGARTAYIPVENERVVILDMPSIRDQGRMFARLVLFVERGGLPKTRIMTVPEVKEWLVKTTSSVDNLTIGNNLRASELARFFNTARNQGEPLTTDELELYESLLGWQVLRDTESGVAVMQPERMLITIPQTSSIDGCAYCSVSPAQRDAIMQHEMAHARFATDTTYQDYSLWFWSNTLSPMQRERFTQFLIRRGYDPTNRELMANEAQAFLMHTPDPHMFSAQALGITERELAELRQAFLGGVAGKPLANAGGSYRLE